MKTLKHKIRIGVMGSASGKHADNKKNQEMSFELGKQIALHDCILVNGACPGLPDYAAKGAQSVDGFVIGISPAFSQKQHVKEYGSPMTPDLILYTGMGFMERDIINIRSADAVVIVGGGIGTLNEFTVAYSEQHPIGVLSSTSGLAEYIPDILAETERELRDNIIIAHSPELIIKKLVEYIEEHPLQDTPDQEGQDRDKKMIG